MKIKVLLVTLVLLVFHSCSTDPEIFVESEVIDEKEKEEEINVDVPKLLTDSISELTLYSVTLGGKIIDQGKSAVTELGIVVGLSSGATIDSNFNKFVLQADSSGKFSTIVIEIPPNTEFYIRAYGINEQGVGYGNEITFNSLSDNVVWGPIYLTNQKEVNDFGAKNYTSIINSLNIEGSDIIDLTPLKSLVIIESSLSVIGTSLKNLKGLDNVEIIGAKNASGISYIQRNPLLEDLSGLENVKMITCYFGLWDNESLTSLKGLDNLHILYWDFDIGSCSNLQSLNGLENLTYVGGDINIHNNPLLNDLKAFQNVETSGRMDLRMSGNISLTNLDGFEKINKINTLSLKNNPNLRNINSLKNLDSLYSLDLDNNEKLSDLSAMNNLKSIHYLTIQNCSSITDLTGFSNLERIEELLTISYNSNLKELKGLEKLHTINRINIHSNNLLQNIEGLSGLRSILSDSYSLTISYNPLLTSLNGLENINLKKGRIFIGYNSPQLEYCALKPVLLNYIGEDFYLELEEGRSVTQSEVISNCP